MAVKRKRGGKKVKEAVAKKKVEEVVEEVEEVVEETISEEVVEVETEEEVVEEVETEDYIEETTEQLLHYQKTKGGSFWMGAKCVKPNEKFWWAKDALPKAFADLFTVLEERPIKANRADLGRGIFVVEELADGGFVILNSETDKDISVKLSKANATRICKELNT